MNKSKFIKCGNTFIAKDKIESISTGSTGHHNNPYYEITITTVSGKKYTYKSWPWSVHQGLSKMEKVERKAELLIRKLKNEIR